MSDEGGKGSVVGTVFLVIVVAVVYVWCGKHKDSTVSLKGNIPEYAMEFMAENGIIEADELVLAFYDMTVRTTAAEGLVLTESRLVYYDNGKTKFDVPAENVTYIGQESGPVEGTIKVYFTARAAPSFTVVMSVEDQPELFLEAVAKAAGIEVGK